MRPLHWRLSLIPSAPSGAAEPFWPEPLPSPEARNVLEWLVPYFWPIMFGGICASALGLRLHFASHNPSTLLAVLLACLGYVLAGLACRRAGRFLAGESSAARRIARLYDVGVVLVAAGSGSLVFTTLAGQVPPRLELLALMLAMAILGVAHATAVRRPWAGAMQVVGVVVPTVAGLLVFWHDWVGKAAAGGLVLYGVIVIVMAWHMYLRQVEMAAAREALTAERGRLATAVANMPYALVVVDSQFRPITWNERCLDLLGLTGMADGSSFLDLLAAAPALGLPDSTRRDALVVRARRLTRSGTPVDTILRLADGRVLDVEAQPTGDGGWVIVLRDTTGEHQTLAELSREARRCPLTGLPNRRAFMEVLEARHAGGQPFTLMLADLDAFKKINERYGHSVGDRVLQAVALRLRTATDDVFVARLGGDEFAILADAVTEPAALAVAEQICAQGHAPLRFEDLSIPVGIAVGVACAPRDGPDPAALMHAADLALLAAKQQQRPCAVMFRPALRVEAEARDTTELRVRSAIRAGAVDVAYQPIVDITTGRVTGIEALARWRDDGRNDGGGVIRTDAMVAIAEQRDLIADLRRVVLREATRVASGLDPALNLWFNVSVLDLVTPGFVRELEDCFLAARIDPRRVVAELTESALMTNEEMGLDALVALRAMGVRVALDDFGAGFSSLERLRRLPIDDLKLSGGLIAGASDDRSAASIVSAAARLGRTINLDIVAEGIETLEDLCVVREAGIARVQGYLFAPAVPAERLAATIAATETAMPVIMAVVRTANTPSPQRPSTANAA